MLAMPLRTVLKGLKIKGNKGVRYLHGTPFCVVNLTLKGWQLQWAWSSTAPPGSC